MTKARRGRVLGFGFGFDSHDLTRDLSGSSKAMYWKVRLWMELGYDFLTMVRTRVNSDGVRGSSGWYRPRHGIGEKVKKEERKKKSVKVEEAMPASPRMLVKKML